MKKNELKTPLSHSMIKKNLFTEISKDDFDKIFLNQEYISYGMQSEVYKAFLYDAPVAIKFLRKQFVGPDLISYIKSEIQTLEEVNHENIVSFIDSYEVVLGKKYNQRKYCIVTQFCEASLNSCEKLNQLSDLEKLKMCYQLVAGIKAAHDKEIIHRDIKPQNILIKDLHSMTIKLADFGCSRFKDVKDTDLEMTSNIGTPLYSDPNVSIGKYTKKCDVYSAGLVIIYIFCGQHFFSHCKSTKEKLLEIKKEFSQNTEKCAKEFLKKKKYNLSSEIQQFLLSIAMYTLSEKEQNRFDSKDLLEFIGNQLSKLQKQQLYKNELNQSKNSPQSKKLQANQSEDFQQIKSKTQQQGSQMNDIDRSQKNGKLMKKKQTPEVVQSSENFIKQSNFSQGFVQLNEANDNIRISDFSQIKSKQTQDRLTVDPKFSLKSSIEQKQIYYSFLQQNQSFENQESQLDANYSTSQHKNKNQQKTNQSHITKMSSLKNQTQSSILLSRSPKKQKNKSIIETQRYGSAFLSDRSKSNISTQQFDLRKSKIQQSLKQLNENQILCAQIIKSGKQCAAISEECQNMKNILKKIRLYKNSFEETKKIASIHSTSMTLEQKQSIAFMFHLIYACEIKNFRNFIIGQNSKFHGRFGKICTSDKQILHGLFNQEIEKIFSNLRKWAFDLNRKANLIKPKLNGNILNVIKEILSLKSSGEIFTINLQEKLILTEIEKFIEEKLREMKNQEDKNVLLELQNVLVQLTS